MELARAKNGLVHVLAPGGGGEYTFCGLEMQEGGGDPGLEGGSSQDLSLEKVTGCLPNCMECKEQIKQIREAIRGVRFSEKLRSICDGDYDSEEWGNDGK